MLFILLLELYILADKKVKFKQSKDMSVQVKAKITCENGTRRGLLSEV